ncbi:MAG: hypothetical protein ACE5HN_08180 [Nitrospiria bacterium]
MEPIIVVVFLVVVFITLSLFLGTSAERPLFKVKTICPEMDKEEEVGIFVNIFKDPEKGGLDVKTCSKFFRVGGPVTCKKGCLCMKEARDLAEREFQKHQRDLLKVGRILA